MLYMNYLSLPLFEYIAFCNFIWRWYDFGKGSTSANFNSIFALIRLVMGLCNERDTRSRKWTQAQLMI
jgi:hypothetical protein